MPPKLTFLFLLFFSLCTTSSFSQSPFKKIAVTVTDISTGKPVENAEVNFKGLIFRQKKKTGADGKALGEIYLASDIQKINIEVKNEIAGVGHKTYQTSVTLTKGQDYYELSAPMKPAYKKITIRVVDEKNQPVSNAEVTIKGNPDETVHTPANGTAIFNIPYPEGSTITSLSIKREGYEVFKTNIDTYSQNPEAPILSALKKSSTNVSSSYDVAKPPTMLGPTSNVNTGLMEANLNESGETSTVLPYTPICNKDPFTGIPSFNSAFVEDEKTINSYITQSCLGFTWDAVNSLTEFIVDPPKFNLSDTNLLKDASKAKDVFDKLKAFYDKVNKIPKDPIDFTVQCIYGGLEKYAIAKAPELLQPIKNIETSVSDYSQAKKDITDKINSIQEKINKNEAVDYAGELKEMDKKQGYQRMKNLYTSLNSTYSLMSTLLNSPEKLLPYDQQASNYLARLKAMMDNITRNCQLAEANQLLQQAVMAAQLGLGGARKSKAQAEKQENNLSDEINVIIKKYPAIVNWQATGNSSFGVEGLPAEVREQYREWVAAHNQFYEQTLRTTNLTNQLQTLISECGHLEQIANSLNKLFIRYKDIYSEGMKMVSNCKLEDAESKVTELLSIETADCGKLLNKNGSEPLSKQLNKLISDVKNANACQSKEQKNPQEIDAGVFVVTSKDWLSTGVAVNKGDGVRVIADGEFVSQSDPKFKFGPGGGGYWVWWVLKTKVSKQMQDVGTKGSMYIQEDGTLELGAPRVARFFEGDGMDLGGFYRVHVFIQPGKPVKKETTPPKTTTTTTADDTKIKEVSEKNFEKITGIPSSYGIYRLVEDRIKPTGIAVLGKFPDYINKAKELNASVFTLGDKFEELQRDGYEPLKANFYFLDRIADLKQKIVIELGGKKFDGFVVTEVKYMIEKRGYKWGDGGKTLLPPK